MTALETKGVSEKRVGRGHRQRVVVVPATKSAGASGPDPLETAAEPDDESAGGDGAGLQSQEAPADVATVGEARNGAGLLALVTTTWRDIQQTRIAMEQRNLTERFTVEGVKTPIDLVTATRAIEARWAALAMRLLRQHPVWPWLEQFSGLRGIHTARLIAIIGDPRRFPGQQCSAGHTMIPDYAVGDPCPVRATNLGEEETSCPGVMQPPRTTSGVRSLWHFCGLHVVDGRSPRRKKGQRASWSPDARTAVLQPKGIAEHIVQHQVEPYVGIYYATKERLSRERGIAADAVIGQPIGAALTGGPEVDTRAASGSWVGLRPGQINDIARKVAAKAFVGDLLIAMKEAVK